MSDNQQNITVENISNDLNGWQQQAIQAMNDKFPEYMHYHNTSPAPHDVHYYLTFQWAVDFLFNLYHWLSSLLLWIFVSHDYFGQYGSLCDYFMSKGLLMKSAMVISILVALYVAFWWMRSFLKIINKLIIEALNSFRYNRFKYGTFLAMIKPKSCQFTFLNPLLMIKTFEKVLNLIMYVFQKTFYLIIIYGLIRYNTGDRISLEYLVFYGIPLFFAISAAMRFIPFAAFLPNIIVMAVRFVLVKVFTFFVTIIALSSAPLNKAKYKLHNFKYRHGRTTTYINPWGETIYKNDLTRTSSERFRDLFIVYLPSSFFIISIMTVILFAMLILSHYASKLPLLMFVVVIPIVLVLFKRLRCTENIMTLDISIAYVIVFVSMIMMDFSIGFDGYIVDAITYNLGASTPINFNPIIYSMFFGLAVINLIRYLVFYFYIEPCKVKAYLKRGIDLKAKYTESLQQEQAKQSFKKSNRRLFKK